jgi:hypothetical protein
MSGKFPFMKARICVCAIVSAAGLLTALAEEPRTNPPAAPTVSVPAVTNEVAVPPPPPATSAPVPAPVHKVKPPVVVPLTPTNTISAPTNASALSSTTSTSATSVAGEPKAPEEESLTPAGGVPAESNLVAGTVSGSSGMKRNIVIIGVVILVVAGGVVVVLMRRKCKCDHASLITRAMSETKDEDPHEDRHEDKPEGKQGDTTVTKKSPPPMT